jgi:hypothetical protein
LASFTRRELLTTAAGRKQGRPAFAAPSIRPREEWAVDRPPRGRLSDEDVRFLIVHHSASHNGHSGAEAPAILRSFYDFHVSNRGWNDIAYNFLVDADGGIWEGRAGSLDGPVAGDATGGNQGYTQLVCVIGDYDTAEPSSASITSLVSLLAWLADRYDIATSPGSEVSFVSRGSNRHPGGAEVITPTITGHRTMSKTSCPGGNLDGYVVDGLLADVEAARAAAIPSTTTTAPTTSTTETTTTIPTSSTSVATSTTLPIAGPVRPEGSAGLTGIVSSLGALVVTAAGFLVWRRRRMRQS